MKWMECMKKNMNWMLTWLHCQHKPIQTCFVSSVQMAPALPSDFPSSLALIRLFEHWAPFLRVWDGWRIAGILSRSQDRARRIWDSLPALRNFRLGKFILFIVTHLLLLLPKLADKVKPNCKLSACPRIHLETVIYNFQLHTVMTVRCLPRLWQPAYLFNMSPVSSI